MNIIYLNKKQETETKNSNFTISNIHKISIRIQYEHNCIFIEFGSGWIYEMIASSDRVDIMSNGTSGTISGQCPSLQGKPLCYIMLHTDSQVTCSQHYTAPAWWSTSHLWWTKFLLIFRITKTFAIHWHPLV